MGLNTALLKSRMPGNLFFRAVQSPRIRYSSSREYFSANHSYCELEAPREAFNVSIDGAAKLVSAKSFCTFLGISPAQFEPDKIRRNHENEVFFIKIKIVTKIKKNYKMFCNLISSND